MEIIFKGNTYTNSSIRQGHVPFVIVNHISGGSMNSMDNWFCNATNEVSSAHYGISKEGKIHQYVDIQRMAWANGLKLDSIQNAISPVIRSRYVNPNLYTISIEHEGTDGDLTEAQFAASIWLHQWIRMEVARIYGVTIKFDREHVIGHCHIDPVRKPFCPGPKFPWERLYQTLEEEDDNMLRDEVKELRETIHELRNSVTVLTAAGNALLNRIEQLESKEQMKIPVWAKEATEAAVKKKLVEDPEDGSYDFYRILTILHRKGMI